MKRHLFSIKFKLSKVQEVLIYRGFKTFLRNTRIPEIVRILNKILCIGFLANFKILLNIFKIYKVLQLPI